MKKIIVCVMMLVATGTITSVNAQDNKKDFFSALPFRTPSFYKILWKMLPMPCRIFF